MIVLAEPTGLASRPSLAAMRRLLMQLSPAENVAMRHKANGLTRKQTGAVMNLSPNVVKNLWQSARRKAGIKPAPNRHECLAS